MATQRSGVFITGLDSFQGTVLRKIAKAKHNVTGRYRKLVADMLKELVLNTPQYSGDLAASWQVVVGRKGEALSPDFVRMNVGLKDADDWYRSNPRQIGNIGALQIAMANNKSAIASIRWNSRVEIVNNNETVAIITSPEGEEALREGNYIPKDVMAIVHTLEKFRYKGFAPTGGGEYYENMET